MQVPNSSGAARPKLDAPPHACDCHMHIYDGARFPPPRPQSRMQPNACVPDYRLFQERIGTSRVVVVTPAGAGVFSFITPGMYRGAAGPDGRTVALYGDESP